MLKSYYGKQIIRMPIKSTIFIILTVFIAMLLMIGFAMFINSDKELKDVNKNFITDVNVENKEWLQMGLDSKAQNINLKEIEAIKNSTYVDKFEIQRNLVGYAENFTPFHNCRYAGLYDTYPYSVFDVTIESEISKNDFVDIFGVFYYNETGIKTYKAKVNRVLSSEEDLDTLYLRIDERIFGKEADNILEVGKRYVVNTQYGHKTIKSANWKFGEAKTDDYEAVAFYFLYPVFKNKNGEGEFIVAHEIISDEANVNDYEIEQYSKISRFYSMNNKEFDIAFVASTNNIKAFYNKNLVIEQGRDITENEYKDGSRVCIINKETFDKNNLKIGDKLEFKYSENNNEFVGYVDEIGVLDSIKERTIIDDTLTFEIVGVYSGNKTTSYSQTSYYFEPSVIIAPITTFPVDKAPSVYNSDLCASSNLTIVLKNSTDKNNFLVSINSAGVDFNKYNILINTKDIEIVIDTFNEMKQTSLMLLIGCIIIAVLIVLFIVFLFISKRKMDIAIQIALGTKRKSIIIGYLVSIGLIVFVGSLLGVAIGEFIAKEVINNSYVKVRDEMMTMGQMFSTTYSFYYAKNYYKVAKIPKIVFVGIVLSFVIFTKLIGFILIKINLKKEPMVLLSTKER